MEVNNKKYPFILEIIPVALFFILSKYYDIYVATASLMISSVINIIISYFYTKKLHTMPLVTVIFAIVFGSLTLLLQDDTFIKIKITIIYLVLATALLSGFLFKKNLLKLILFSHIAFEDKGWSILTLLWAGFFVLLAIVNEIIWRNFSTDTWINFKVFGIFILMFIFLLIQVPIISKYKK